MERERAATLLERAMEPGRGKWCRGTGAFTLIELLAVVVIVIMLAAIVLGVAGYADRASKINRAKAELATLASAIESYRSETGRYPTSSVVHYSVGGGYPQSWAFAYQWEVYNSWLLLNQLRSSNPHLSLNSPCAPVLSNFFLCCSDQTNELMQVLRDPWGQPYIYYCTYPPRGGVTATNQSCSMITLIYPNGPDMLTNACSVQTYTNGQINLDSYDLYSMGPDQRTRVPGITVTCQYYGDPSTVNDDLWVGRLNR